MALFIYTALMILSVPLILIWFVYQVTVKGKYKRGFSERLGSVSTQPFLSSGPVFWVHAASVGEVMAAEPLLSGLKQQIPSAGFVITTNTDTGHKTAIETLRTANAVYQTPFDLPWCVNRFIRRIHPSILIIMETEIWPHMIVCAKKHRIPVVIANGRISDRAFRRYLKLKWFFSALLKRPDMFIMQSRADAEKILCMGATENRVIVAGNVKYDRKMPESSWIASEQVLKRLGWSGLKHILVAGSTHSQEEDVICRAFRRVLHEVPDIKMVLAPRHTERTPDVCNTLKKQGLSFVTGTQLKQTTDTGQGSTQVLVLDVMGELLSYYAAGSIAFVGGSLQNIGGHNVLEPAALSKPVLFGPYTANFKDAVSQLVDSGGGRYVRSHDELAKCIIELCRNPEHAVLMGEKALMVVTGNRGAVDRHVLQILQVIPDELNRSNGSTGKNDNGKTDV